ncbi:hypothetical protein PV08_06029 [Exophiala spinifera]|uniref:UBR-type domain-containing protein n=1 Tax=Exophiala spinifera TaxID=91928 RepID=A0A0D2BXH7_9EURO|nr:uncharacterized protein PV08_06029 [Exophiala spinifera]KIW15979.1 hypothetical protein PV08_06029 [Exophiala spinifera]
MDSNSDIERANQVQNHGQATQDSQTASDFIDQQLALEADAREVLPYKFDKCTHVLGPLRQTIFACLTCSPPPASAAQVYTPAGVCYSCSISCHGEHNLVELFSRRNFVCDCGTKRLPSTSSCMLRSDPTTGARGVHSQEPAPNNQYNHNFQNHFCACGEEYDPETEKGTMFQCLGLGTVESGGCGEDWYHPECLMGLPRDWYKEDKAPQGREKEEGEPSHPTPPGFPSEDDFEHLLCYKCVESNPWIKQYAGTPGFLEPVFHRSPEPKVDNQAPDNSAPPTNGTSLKRKASDTDLDKPPSSPSKRIKDDLNTLSLPTSAEPSSQPSNDTNSAHKHELLPPAPEGTFSLFLTSSFRDHICHCPQCYPKLIPHPQLVEEEDTYEPSLSDASSQANSAGVPGSGTRSHGTASLLDRGEAALSTMDRVKAIQGVMVYNHLRDKVKEFLKPYAESGQVVSAEDIKSYFEKLRGDENAIKEARDKPVDGNEDGDADNRREQSGY